MRARRGYLLVEALCALALGGLLAAAAASVLTSARVAVERLDARIGAERVGRESLGVASALIRASDSIVVLGDTAVEMTLRIGSGVVCGADSVSLWVAPSRVSVGDTLTSWAQLPDVGDEVAVLVRDTLTGDRRWVGETVDAVAERVPEEPCDVEHGWVSAGDVGARMTVLTLRAPLPGAGAGVPLRVTRRCRLALYVDGRGEWMLGWKRCLLGACGVVQPAAGPLRTPASGGFTVTGPDASGLVWISVHAAGAVAPLQAVVARADAIR